MRHGVPAIDLFECGIIFAHAFVRLVIFVGGIRMHPLKLNIAVQEKSPAHISQVTAGVILVPWISH
jgi:hypothetical protein